MVLIRRRHRADHMPHGLGHRRPVGKAEVIEADQGQHDGRIRESCRGCQNLDLVPELKPR